MPRTALSLLLWFSALLVAGSAFAQDAPFGLTWNMSATQLLALDGVEVLNQEEGKAFHAVVATRLPKNLNYTDTYGLLFSNRSGLLKVVWSSTPIRQDRAGRMGRERFSELRSKLADKYGAPVEVRQGDATGVPFYECLRQPNCGGEYRASWIVGPIGVRLELVGESAEEGRVRLTYQHQLLDTEMADVAADRADQERDAL